MRFVQIGSPATAVPIGWNRGPVRARDFCCVCWGSLAHLAHVEFCPHCRTEFIRK